MVSTYKVQILKANIYLFLILCSIVYSTHTQCLDGVVECLKIMKNNKKNKRVRERERENNLTG